ncbi:MAG: hypothetical protein ACR2QG_04840 [Gammaproteobacteria bacterium]
MFTSSLLARSGQLWKFVFAVLALLVGSFAPLYPETGLSWTAGTVIAIGGYGFAIWSIHCAKCGSRWLWEATKGEDGYEFIYKSAKECSGCSK